MEKKGVAWDIRNSRRGSSAYDEAVILMSGRNVKTDFMVDVNRAGNGNSLTSSGGNNPIFPILDEKLRKCCRKQAPSLMCLRLDIENSRIGVWQKRPRSDSTWIMTVELGKKNSESGNDSKVVVSNEFAGNGLDEQKVALQMIEEFLNRN
ncbi:hypothetical protein V6N13_032813 [Hibiscus sabdariffa]